MAIRPEKRLGAGRGRLGRFATRGRRAGLDHIARFCKRREVRQIAGHQHVRLAAARSGREGNRHVARFNGQPLLGGQCKTVGGSHAFSNERT